MKALVVGGTGFVGAAAVTAFTRRGIAVVCLSRSGGGVAGASLVGDVTVNDFGLRPARLDDLRESITHIVSCFGSVDWGCGPREAMELHRAGTLTLMRFAESCHSLERFVHVSSVLVLGRASGRVSDELELGQSFRNWYEYGKYLAEQAIRDDELLPWRVLRVGPVLGPGAGVSPSAAHGLLSAVPFLLRGFPVHLAQAGQFPCYPCDGATAGEVIVRAALEDGQRDVWTWFDQANPTLADVLTALCDAWGVLPRIVRAPALARFGRFAYDRLGAPRELLDYADPWAEIEPEVLSSLPTDLPLCPPGYLHATGAALRRSGGLAIAA
jgi:nucleoside-diphosphate-sugar epimerase